MHKTILFAIFARKLAIIVAAFLMLLSLAIAQQPSPASETAEKQALINKLMLEIQSNLGCSTETIVLKEKIKELENKLLKELEKK